MLTLPKILDVPEKLIPLIIELDRYRYFLVDGGRVSAKSQTVARLLLYLGERYNLRIFCGREIQASVEESVYTLFCDLIRAHNLAYKIFATKIDHRSSGTTIRFHGFREQGAVNIKGLEGVDILWVDEAQAITKNTLDIIVPTIRKNKSKVFWTMNRYLDDDPVYVEFHGRPDCLSIHVDYFDNPHCPAALRHEAEQCKLKNKDDYEHIWLGLPLKSASNAAFRGVEKIVRDYELPMIYVPEFEYSLGADLGRSIDNTVLTVINKQLKRLDYFERMESENRTSWAYQKEKILAVSRKYGNCQANIDSTGVGDPIVEDLQRMGCNIFYNQSDGSKETPGVKFTNVSKENLVEKLKVAVELELITIPNIPVLIRELTRFQCITLPSGRHRYQAPNGEHDDCVFSLALAVWGARDFIYSPEYRPPQKPMRTDEFWVRVKRDLQKRDNDLQGEEVEFEIGEGTEILID
jgi:PBSX family phage terminase large subunit